MYDWNTMLTEFDVKEAKRINDALAPRDDILDYLRGRARMSTLDKVLEAIDSPIALAAYIGFFAGCFATVLTAIIWGTML